MYNLFKKFSYLLSMVYMAQFFISLFFDVDDVDRWSRWTEVGFHLGICCGCLFVCAVVWAYERINHKK